jgi:hypothetical protein
MVFYFSYVASPFVSLLLTIETSKEACKCAIERERERENEREREREIFQHTL